MGTIEQEQWIGQAAFECIRYLVESDAIKDWEFHIRTGVTQDEMRETFTRWPKLADADPSSNDHLIINNAFNEVCHGLSISPAEWRHWFSQPPETVEKAFWLWRAQFPNEE